MKKLLTLLLLCSSLFVIGQNVPDAINYQSVLRNSNGSAVPNQNVSIRFSILQGSVLGTFVFQEEHSITTSDIGLINLKIGEGLSTLNSLSSINWSLGPYFLEIEIDTTSTGNYISYGTSELSSVPYSLYSKSSASSAVTDSLSPIALSSLPQFSLTEAQVDSMVANNGYLTTEVDGSITNEIQDLVLSSNNLSITNNTSATTVDLSGYLDNTVLTETQVDAYAGNNGYLTTEVDGSITNEIQDLVLSSNNLSITNNTSATTVDLSGYLDNTDTVLTEAQVDSMVANNGYLTTEVDSSITNEIQILSISNDTIFLSGGGFAKLPAAQAPPGADGNSSLWQTNNQTNLNGSAMSFAPSGPGRFHLLQNVTSWGTAGQSTHQLIIHKMTNQPTPTDYTDWLEFIDPYDIITIRVQDSPERVMHFTVLPLGTSGSSPQNTGPYTGTFQSGDLFFLRLRVINYAPPSANANPMGSPAFDINTPCYVGYVKTGDLDSTNDIQDIEQVLAIGFDADSSALNNLSELTVGTNTIDTSAIMEVSSTSKGFLPPRMTAAQRDLIYSPAAGLMIWCLDCGSNGQLQVFNGSQYTDIIGGQRALAKVQLGADIDGEAANDLSGWSVSLSSDGSTVAIGAPYNDANGANSGHVRIYENVSGTWTQLGADIDGEAASDFSGQSVSLSSDGTIIAIGAEGNDANGANSSGHVRIYENVSGTWTQLGADIDGEAASDLSGWSVSLSSDGSTVAIGATGDPVNAANSSGHVRIYEIK